LSRLALVAAAAALTLAACDDDVRSHIYSGEAFDTTLGCLEPLQSIDVVEGPAPGGTCAPTCILSLPDDADPQQVFVSSMCAPYPLYPYDSDAGSDPRCVAAIAAFERNTLCEDGGGILNPFPDAAADAGASTDAATVGDATVGDGD
jgi:hypothetical protein